MRLTLLGTATSGAYADQRRLGRSAVLACGQELYMLDCGNGTAAALRAVGEAADQVTTLLLTRTEPLHIDGLRLFLRERAPVPLDLYVPKDRMEDLLCEAVFPDGLPPHVSLRPAPRHLDCGARLLRVLPERGGAGLRAIRFDQGGTGVVYAGGPVAPMTPELADFLHGADTLVFACDGFHLPAPGSYEMGHLSLARLVRVAGLSQVILTGLPPVLDGSGLHARICFDMAALCEANVVVGEDMMSFDISAAAETEVISINARFRA